MFASARLSVYFPSRDLVLYRAIYSGNIAGLTDQVMARDDVRRWMATGAIFRVCGLLL